MVYIIATIQQSSRSKIGVVQKTSKDHYNLFKNMEPHSFNC